MLGMAQTLGIKGVVADGVIRDIKESRALNFPVFCKGTTVSSSSKVGGGEVNVTISCGGVAIQPGDIIVGDADGVVVIPQKNEDAILTESLKKLEFDQQREAEISENPDAIKMYLDNLLSK
jgi:4-hydroxy-4-methyl-2-oxoglutarate aldolase